MMHMYNEDNLPPVPRLFTPSLVEDKLRKDQDQLSTNQGQSSNNQDKPSNDQPKLNDQDKPRGSLGSPMDNQREIWYESGQHK